MPYSDYNFSMNEYMKNRWINRREKAVQYLGGQCKVCQTKTDLEFDHIEPSTKICSIARASSFSEERFWQEVDKCQLLCKTHHIEKSIANGDLKHKN